MMQNQGALTAADQDDTRLQRVRDNFSRLGVANARSVRCNWVDEESIRAADFAAQSFDRILVDAPCTQHRRDATPGRCPLAVAAG